MRKVILILGRTGEGKTTLAKKIRSKFSKVITFDPLSEYDGIIFTDFESFSSYVMSLIPDWGNSKFNITCRFTSDIDVESGLEFTRSLTDTLLVIEETEIYLNPRNPNRSLIEHIRYGRHYNISLLCVARRSMEFNIDLRSQYSSIYTFRQSEERDLEVLKQYEFNETEIRNLQPHSYIFIGEDFLNAGTN